MKRHTEPKIAPTPPLEKAKTTVQTVRLSQDQLLRLKIASVKLGLNQQEIMVEALNHYLTAKGIQA